MIKNIKFKNNKVLGNLLLDFSKETGKPYKTIVFVGENGAGKTNVLEAISNYLTFGSIIGIDYINYYIGEEIYKIIPLEIEDNAKIGNHYRYSFDGSQSRILNDKEKSKNDPLDLRGYGCVYSKSKTGFNTKPIKSTTTLELDSDFCDKDNEDDYTSIKQLLIDIQDQDNTAYFELGRQYGSYDYEEFEKNSKLYRFKKAFNSFFDNIKLKNITISNNKKLITFEKHGVEIDIDDLSTGEKQIVFRGAKLLRNINNINGGTILIDEPELSMHPMWQKKIFDFYRNLFIDASGEQTAQLIIATHSEYILNSALNSDNTLIINLQNDNGKIIASNIKTPFTLPTMTFAEINYRVFNVCSIDYHIQLYGEIQNISNTDSILACDSYIKNHPLYNSGYYKLKNFHGRNYETLPTYIRNCIDHPDSQYTYSDEEFKKSIEFMISVIEYDKNSVH